MECEENGQCCWRDGICKIKAECYPCHRFNTDFKKCSQRNDCCYQDNICKKKDECEKTCNTLTKDGSRVCLSKKDCCFSDENICETKDQCKKRKTFKKKSKRTSQLHPVTCHYIKFIAILLSFRSQPN